MAASPDRKTVQRVDALRVPPHSFDAEQAVLGGLMLSPEAWDKVADRLNEDDFYRKDHRVIFRAITELSNKGMPCDAVTLGEWFESQGLADLVGGTAYILQLANTTPSAANIIAYCDIVREKSVLRQLIDAGTEIVSDGFAPEGRSTQEILEGAEQRVFRIAEAGARGRQGFVPMRTAVKDAFAILHHRFENRGTVTGMPTGFTDLDEMTAGLQPSDLIIVAARPAMGKTAFSLNMAEYAAMKTKRAVAVFSMEMSASQLAFRLISSVGRINQQHLRNGDIQEEEWPRVTSAITLLSEAKIFIDDTPALSPGELRARCRRLKREHDLGLIVIDYLQLMQVPGNKENRATEISEISRSLKALAKELNVPVIALSQLNRSLEQRQDKRPVMADLRESGAIEQDADVIMFIYRDDYYNRETSKEPGVAEIIIAKQRNGPVGTCKLAFLKPLTKFDNLAPGYASGGDEY
jgi:replicative DNA helicase